MVDKSITMKTIITFTFLLFSYLGFSQTTREEVVERTDLGQKIKVNTYTGTGNSEKLVKRTTYDSGSTGTIPVKEYISLKPIQIAYFGAYKYESTYDGKTTTKINWGIIKIEAFNPDGTLNITWKITDDNYSSTYSSSKYTLLP